MNYGKSNPNYVCVFFCNLDEVIIIKVRKLNLDCPFSILSMSLRSKNPNMDSEQHKRSTLIPTTVYSISGFPLLIINHYGPWIELVMGFSYSNCSLQVVCGNPRGFTLASAASRKSHASSSDTDSMQQKAAFTGLGVMDTNEAAKHYASGL